MSSRAIAVTKPDPAAEETSSDATRILIVVVASLVILAPVAISGVPSNRDLVNHFRFALPFFESLRSGHPYPGWLAESNAGYGDPSFRFYPPVLYYLLALSRALIGNWYSGTILTFILLSVGAGLGMYFWARSVSSASTAMWAGIFYSFAPYHVNQLYQAFLLAEYAGAAVLPFVFGFVERVCENRRRRDVAGLAATYAVLILTHLPLAVIASLALPVYAVMRIEKPHRLDTAKGLILAAALGLAASGFYWITMIAEMPWIGINAAQPDSSVDYRLNFVFSTFSPDNLNVWWMNILVILTLLMLGPAVALFRPQSRTAKAYALKPVAALMVGALFMATPLSRPLWRAIPPLQQTQFPWRWLVLVSMAASLLSAASMSCWLANRPRPQRSMSLLVYGSVLVSFAFTMAHIVREAQYLPRAQFEGAIQAVHGTTSVKYWFPIWASPAPENMRSEVEVYNRSVTIHDWSPEERRFEVSAGGPAEARVRTFYYPHWIATGGGQTLKTRPDRDGALLISLPAEPVSVNLTFREPVRVHCAAALSAIGWLFIGGLAVLVQSRGER